MQILFSSYIWCWLAGLLCITKNKCLLVVCRHMGHTQTVRGGRRKMCVCRTIPVPSVDKFCKCAAKTNWTRALASSTICRYAKSIMIYIRQKPFIMIWTFASIKEQSLAVAVWFIIFSYFFFSSRVWAALELFPVLINLLQALVLSLSADKWWIEAWKLGRVPPQVHSLMDPHLRKICCPCPVHLSIL